MMAMIAPPVQTPLTPQNRSCVPPTTSGTALLMSPPPHLPSLLTEFLMNIFFTRLPMTQVVYLTRQLQPPLQYPRAPARLYPNSIHPVRVPPAHLTQTVSRPALCCRVTGGIAGGTMKGAAGGLRRVKGGENAAGKRAGILVTLLVFTIFAILLTLLLIHILNPDKEPLPWRAYCSIPSASTVPPSLSATSYSPGYPFNSLAPSDVSSLSSMIPNTFPPPHLDDYPPAGVFLGVFTMDSAVERRMLVRSTWASHERSRNGAGAADDGLGTSRTIVRFVLGKPRSSWERRIQLESETYNDMIVLPIPENMNSGKTHAFFTWASEDAWVPPLPREHNASHAPKYSYSSITATDPVRLATHDPKLVRQEWRASGEQAPWVRPDFVVKVDDDSFVMLAELEARLRVELHTKARFTHHENGTLHSRYPEPGPSHSDMPEPDVHKSAASASAVVNATGMRKVSRAPEYRARALTPSPLDDPLVYWGYLVKNQFMAGELYALSWNIVAWVARDPMVKTMTRGKEDKQVAKWMRYHPRAAEVRWKSERCWIYDHPRADTVYSHGFLFPSEITRVRKGIFSYLSSATEFFGDQVSQPPMAVAPIGDGSSPASWAYSSVSTFGVRYSPPLPNFTTLQAVEALVEGSEMSKLHESLGTTAEEAWTMREGRRRRYEDKRVGGTVVVHFIKKNPWFLETALALLEGEEQTVHEIKKSLYGTMPDSPTNNSDTSWVHESARHGH
ncbi:hypothetical protein EW145_g791 [Phellinidium pouzarii]|uniref:Glycosyltransferase family 31 protein n=1 Tax=Phellinidium pouzarii TaxID=167371 RepID=A0A4S4LIM8_9AGAM|nr:hypothetical protein EW145_g791 [Phellinidium pouzarii]